MDGTALTDLATYRVYVDTSSAPCPGAFYQSVPSPTSTPTSGDIINYQLTGLNTGATFYVKVTAVDGSGTESSCSNLATGIAKAGSGWPDTTPPTPASSRWVAVTAKTSFSKNVAYTQSSGDGVKTVYGWYKDGAGNVSARASDTIRLDRTPPSNGTLTAIAGNAKVSLSWSGFADRGSWLGDTNRYKLVFRTGGTLPPSCSSGTQLLLGNATSFTHTGLNNRNTYSYRVCARDSAGNISTGASVAALPGQDLGRIADGRPQGGRD